tara:strand:- start:199 stop:420 length:222 start_codon:yes stop_codon:yes gene_type:complete
MKEPENEYEALVLALALAISAPPEAGEDKIRETTEYADELAANFDAETVERAKAEAVAIAEKEFGDLLIQGNA